MMSYTHPAKAARKALEHSMIGPDIGDAAVDEMASAVDTAMSCRPCSIADVVDVLKLVLASEGDTLEDPVHAAIFNSIIFLTSIAGSVQ